MSLEAIKIISSAERLAQDIRVEAQTQIRKIKTDSELEGKQEITLGIEYASEISSRLIADAEIKGAQRAREILERSRLENEAFKARSSKRIEKAVELIVERVVVT